MSVLSAEQRDTCKRCEEEEEEEEEMTTSNSSCKSGSAFYQDSLSLSASRLLTQLLAHKARKARKSKVLTL